MSWITRELKTFTESERLMFAQKMWDAAHHPGQDKAIVLELAWLHIDAWSHTDDDSVEGRTQCIRCGDYLTDVQWLFDPCPESDDGSHEEAGEGEADDPAGTPATS